MKNKFLQPGMLGGLFLTVFLCWYILYRAVMVPEASIWAAPITIFFILLVVFYTSMALVKNTAYLAAVLAVSFLAGLVFAATPLHLACLALSCLAAYLAVRQIRGNLRDSIRLSFFNSFMSGRSYFVFALIVAITSQYYALVSRRGGEVNLPTFEISKEVAYTVGKIYGHINPEYSFFSSARGMTVDTFILRNQSAVPAGQAPERADAALKAVLEKGRKQLSELSGRQLNGGEQVADVFVDLATRKINDYFSAGIAQSGKSSPMPLFLTCVLFLSLLPVATIVGYAGTIFSALLCGVLLKKGFIKKKARQVQAESLVL